MPVIAVADRFGINGLPAGEYKVAFEAPDGTNLVAEHYDDAADVSTADPVRLSAEEDETGIDAELATGATMKSTVTNRTRLVERPITWDDKVWLTWQRDGGVVLTE